MRLHLHDVGLFEVGQLELVDDAVEELALFGPEVPLRPVLEEVEEVDVPLGQAQVLVSFARCRVLHEAELDEGREVEEDDDGAELEGRKELRPSGRLPFILGFRVVFGHGNNLYGSAGADFFLRTRAALMNSSRRPSRTRSVSPVSSRVRRPLIMREGWR